jgi:signal transduction histidine kinase
VKEEAKAGRSLARTISIRVAAVTIVVITLQLLVVVGQNYIDDDFLSLDHVSREAELLLSGVKVTPNGPAFKLPRRAAYYIGESRAAYGFRVVEDDGHILASENADLIAQVSPWSGLSRPATTLWFRKLEDGQRFHFAGGKRFQLDGRGFSIEIMTLGDPRGVHWRVVAYETIDDVWLPILPFALLVLIVTLTAVRRSLRPLVIGAEQAELINPGDPAGRLEISKMPLEAAGFASAINRLLQRVRTLLRSQQVFIASAAHELRTPLAVMLLELEKIDHPRAARLKADITGMTETVNRLLTLAGLEAMQPQFQEVDIKTIAADLIERLRPWAEERQHILNLLLDDPGHVRGDPLAVREALRNLIENAVRHTPRDTVVQVTVGPGTQVAVDDGGPGLPATDAEQLFQPFQRGNQAGEGAGLGLAIVRQAVQMHGGAIEVGRSSLGGARFTVRFS